MSQSSDRKFRLGVNYWPARSAMGWWTAFEPSEVATDFARIAACGFDSVRIFLTWEDFQPTPSKVEGKMLERLVVALDQAKDGGLSVMPTLFTGHMSGANWIPAWALGRDAGDERFRVMVGGGTVTSRLANWYSDTRIIEAQAYLAGELAGALKGHPALWAWDLGNENSNCTIPPDPESGSEWLRQITYALRNADPVTPITIGLHMEDLESNRNLGPKQAAEVCDFLTMHGYPGYASWAEGPTDERLLPFLTQLTSWLGGGAEVLFSEFGVPTQPLLDNGKTKEESASSGPALVTEEEAALYVKRALKSLQNGGSTGAMLWCYSDYAPAIWNQPPLDLAPHERSFGLWHSDGSEKPSIPMIRDFANTLDHGESRTLEKNRLELKWLDVDAEEFYRTPELHLPRLYRRYCARK